eukprot:TRINITY_DN4459_c0_g1_i1.p1 TRINITY_DN4459_c0_g1~~TRINITY_DN4459_c0_g1_i1.p1  ORF type:complete len:650 (+),score=159.17 TRINITY_DN4459_c0_g1_i1:103-2052(+)
MLTEESSTSGNVLSLRNISTDILFYHVFQWLDIRSVFAALRVCKAWSTVSNNCNFWGQYAEIRRKRLACSNSQEAKILENKAGFFRFRSSLLQFEQYLLPQVLKKSWSVPLRGLPQAHYLDISDGRTKWLALFRSLKEGQKEAAPLIFELEANLKSRAGWSVWKRRSWKSEVRIACGTSCFFSLCRTLLNSLNLTATFKNSFNRDKRVFASIVESLPTDLFQERWKVKTNSFNPQKLDKLVHFQDNFFFPSVQFDSYSAMRKPKKNEGQDDSAESENAVIENEPQEVEEETNNEEALVEEATIDEEWMSPLTKEMKRTRSITSSPTMNGEDSPADIDLEVDEASTSTTTTNGTAITPTTTTTTTMTSTSTDQVEENKPQTIAEVSKQTPFIETSPAGSPPAELQSAQTQLMEETNITAKENKRYNESRRDRWKCAVAETSKGQDLFHHFEELLQHIKKEYLPQEWYNKSCANECFGRLNIVQNMEGITFLERKISSSIGMMNGWDVMRSKWAATNKSVDVSEHSELILLRRTLFKLNAMLENGVENGHKHLFVTSTASLSNEFEMEISCLKDSFQAPPTVKETFELMMQLVNVWTKKGCISNLFWFGEVKELKKQKEFLTTIELKKVFEEIKNFIVCATFHTKSKSQLL